MIRQFFHWWLCVAEGFVDCSQAAVNRRPQLLGFTVHIPTSARYPNVGKQLGLKFGNFLFNNVRLDSAVVGFGLLVVCAEFSKLVANRRFCRFIERFLPTSLVMD